MHIQTDIGTLEHGWKLQHSNVVHLPEHIRRATHDPL